jgi:hypothetical protein
MNIYKQSELGTLYEKRRTQRSRGIIGPAWELTTAAFYSWMRAIFATNDGNIAFWQTGKFLEKLAKQYGHNRRILSNARLELAALRDYNVLLQHADSGAKFIAEKYRNLRESEGIVRVKMKSRWWARRSVLRSQSKSRRGVRSQRRKRGAGQR